MLELVFATNNHNKLIEVQQLLPDTIKLLSLSDIGCNEEIPETAETLAGNAQLKADYVTQRYGYDCFADDTGLAVAALDGAPGVYSARYAGEDCSPEDNIQKLMAELINRDNRGAQFSTVIALNLNGRQHLFEGICKGEILKEKHGQGGFGYDPIFKPTGYATSFAEMTLAEKGKISHRGKAVAKLVAFLTH
jgi:XTP/dITP diphosphohydrolase